MSPDNIDDYQASGPFEGPEKLLEIWFAPSAALVPGPPGANGKTGLRQVDRKIWEDMLDIVKCKVLSVMEGLEIDAYLLSESSLFVSPHKLILKTCGTTLNLLGVPRILEIAAKHANMPTFYRCFYSRKSFMFPERQKGPHRDWKQEVEFLDNIFEGGAAYTIGKVNGDHWLLYMASQGDSIVNSPTSSQLLTPVSQHVPDYTIEILMSDLGKASRDTFFFSEELASKSPSTLALDISHELGINDIFPSHLTSLDAYAFTPCGYSSNALIKWGDESPPESLHIPSDHNLGEGYFTIHVTPEEGWSYASFECNVPLSPSHDGEINTRMIPSIKTLVQRVVSIFQPGRITLTFFISNSDDESGNAIEDAQKAFRAALTRVQHDEHNTGTAGEWHGAYRRTDKINYEFGSYDLAFASFELAP
ncbi:S-adenosylmethionine decarboxylase [Macrolepiota fuliginosa MF-IS2]|uniref:adenosylmethionine decarboxylase n=1 Tax=Macrolepiota fuliginosa MF-IS2 TaxID=1400762 RepID=A0A9P6C7K4_9AGAR|nr:S-adenosylmethionine decarboxylase [Macrolepiota fuliginosa MF-IS2]